MQTLAGLTVYTYKQVTEFTLDSEDYLERNLFCKRSSSNYGKELLLPSEGGREREGGKNWGVLSRAGVIS